jgi:hypothetical protein
LPLCWLLLLRSPLPLAPRRPLKLLLKKLRLLKKLLRLKPLRLKPLRLLKAPRRLKALLRLKLLRPLRLRKLQSDLKWMGRPKGRPICFVAGSLRGNPDRRSA